MGTITPEALGGYKYIRKILHGHTLTAIGMSERVGITPTAMARYMLADR